MSRRPTIAATIVALVAGALAVSLAGCPRRDAPALAPPLATPARVSLPDGGTRHTERLVWGGWRGGPGPAAFVACDRRTPDLALPGTLSRCRAYDAHGVTVEERPALFAPDATAPIARDDSAVDAAPGACRVLVEDLAPGAPPDSEARATLLGPSGRTLLGAFRPRPDSTADYFALEASFSPDGRWIAVARVAVGLGEGERTIEIEGVEVRPAPACQ